MPMNYWAWHLVFDLLLDCTDNFATRDMINRISVRYQPRYCLLQRSPCKGSWPCMSCIGRQAAIIVSLARCSSMQRQMSETVPTWRAGKHDRDVGNLQANAALHI